MLLGDATPTVIADFESGLLTPFTGTGIASIEPGAHPSVGGSETANVDAGDLAGNPTDAAIEAFLDIPVGTLDTISGHAAHVGSAITHTFSVAAGDRISFDWFFETDESDDTFDDFAFFSASYDGGADFAYELISVTHVTPAFDSTPLTTFTSGWLTSVFTAPTAGTLQIGIGAINVSDGEVATRIIVDNVVVNRDLTAFDVVDDLPQFAELATGELAAGLLTASNDTLTGDDDDDTLDGRDGVNDMADFGDAPLGITLDLSIQGGATQAVGFGQGTDTLLNIEHGAGGRGDDTLLGDAGVNILLGRDDDDTLDGGGGFDDLRGGAGNDILISGLGGAFSEGQGGDDTLIGSDSSDSQFGGAGDDTIVGSLGNDTIGGFIDDQFEEDTARDVLDYSATANGVDVDLDGETASSIGTNEIGNDSVFQIEAVLGGSGGDRLLGEFDANTLVGNGGNDTLAGDDGNDTLQGGPGDDTLFGALLTDTFDFDIDTVEYGDATGGITVDLTIQDGTTAQTIGGGMGTDTLRLIENINGGSHNDTLTGSDDANTLRGRAGDDTLSGGLENDTLLGEDGNDTLFGGALFDVLVGGDGDDQLFGGDNDDTLIGGEGADSLDGGGGTDTADYDDADTAINVDLSGGPGPSGQGAVGDTFNSIENIVGTDFDDTIIGDGSANLFFGGDGDDTLRGGAGDDVLVGEGGDDTADFSDAVGAVTVDLNIQGGITQTIGGGLGTDSLQNIENVLGGSGGDTLTGDAFDNTLIGAGGNDTLLGNAGADLLRGGAGNDTVNGGAGRDTADFSDATGGVTVDLAVQGGAQTVGGGLGTDTLIGIENATGGAHNDSLSGDGGANRLLGSAGNDTLDGGSDRDTADFSDATGGVTVDLGVQGGGAQTVGGGQGTDILLGIENAVGGGGGDTLTGDGGANALVGGGGDDTLTGGAGDDSIAGGAGADRAVYAGNRADYDITTDGLATIVRDLAATVDGDDGEDHLYGVETVEFKDQTVALTPGPSWVSGYVGVRYTDTEFEGFLGTGFDMATSADGEETVAISGQPGFDLFQPGDNEFETGRVFVHRWIVTEDGTALSAPAELSRPTQSDDDAFGASVAISRDTDTAVAGASGTDAAYVYRYDGATWVRESQGFFGGDSVAVDGDGNIVVTADRDHDVGGNLGQGQATVSEFDGTAWTQTNITASDGVAADAFGGAVAVAAAADIVVVGADGDGSAYVFEKQLGVWTQADKLTISGVGLGGSGDGWVDVSEDGDLIIVGAEGSGSAYLFRRDGASWTEDSRLDSDVPGFGAGVAISDDGDTITVGGDPGNPPAIYRWNGLDWVPEATMGSETIPPTFFEDLAVFGSTVRLGGDGDVAGYANGSQDSIFRFFSFDETKATREDSGEVVLVHALGEAGTDPFSNDFDEAYDLGTVSRTVQAFVHDRVSVVDGDPIDWFQFSIDTEDFPNFIQVDFDFLGRDGDIFIYEQNADTGEWERYNYENLWITEDFPDDIELEDRTENHYEEKPFSFWSERGFLRIMLEGNDFFIEDAAESYRIGVRASPEAAEYDLAIQLFQDGDIPDPTDPRDLTTAEMANPFADLFQEPEVTADDQQIDDAVSAESLIDAMVDPALSVISYEFWDGTDDAGTGFFTVSGTPQVSGETITVAAADIGTAEFAPGNEGSVDQLFARVFDGLVMSAWEPFNVTTATNSPPDAEADKTVDVTEDTVTALNIAAPTDPDPDPLTITVTAVPTDGVVQIAGGGGAVAIDDVLTEAQLTGLEYDPAQDFNGDPGAFAYTVDDGNGGSDSQTVSLNVTAVNDQPSVSPDTFSVDENQVSGTSVGTVSATDADDPATAFGMLTYSFAEGGNPGGLFAIDPGTGEITTAAVLDHEAAPSHALTVEVTDGGSLSDTATITVNVGNVVAEQTAGDDTLFGDPGSDTMDGLGGNDTLDGKDSGDTLSGGSGGDLLLGGAGADVLYGHDAAGKTPQSYTDTGVFPDVTELTPIDALPVPGDGALGILPADTALGADAVATLTLTGGTAGYNNSLGVYTVAADGTIGDVELVFEQTHSHDPGDTATVPWTGGAGMEFGLFLIIHGGSLNGGYQGFDLDTGTLSFVFDHGGGGERAAKVSDAAGDISLVFDDGETQTLLEGPVVHATERGGPTTLNADGAVHVAAGRIDAGTATALRIGFEDMPGGGDDDFNDVVVDLAIHPGSDPVDDTLAGGPGNDTLTGGIGEDVFQFGAGGGTDRITDFQVGSDRFELLNGLTISSIATTDADGDSFTDDTTVTLSDGAVDLIGVVGVTESDLLGT